MRVGGIVAAALVAITVGGGAAWADAGHGKAYSFGEPGQESEVTRTIEVIADDRDGMRFIMNIPSIQQGEVIKFVVTNQGAGQHEFSVGDTASQRAHAKLMAKNPGMKHESDPTAIHVEPGETKALIWKFSKPVQGNVVFACQMPGHYEGGMVHQAKLEKAKKAKTS